jgi:hypothetical protein
MQIYKRLKSLIHKSVRHPPWSSKSECNINDLVKSTPELLRAVSERGCRTYLSVVVDTQPIEEPVQSHIRHLGTRPRLRFAFASVGRGQVRFRHHCRLIEVVSYSL